MTRAGSKDFLGALRKRIRKSYWKRRTPKKGQAKLSFGEDLRRTVVRHNKKPKKIPADIRIWFALFDEVIGFWFLVWALYKEKLEKDRKPASSRLICLTVLAGRIFQDLICVRRMLEAGFFVQSNVVVRSLVEAVDVMHLINVKPELADEFRAVVSNKDASRFWHTYCSRDKIDKQIKARWHWFVEGSPDAAEAFHKQRISYMDLVGMSAHPSFAASLSSFMDKPEGQKPDNIVYTALGAVSHMSKFTIHLLILRVFEYGLLWVGPEANLYRQSKGAKPLTFKRELLRCLNIIASIARTVDRDDGPNVLFPEFRTYWPRSRFD